MGSPAKVARELSAEEIAWKGEGTRTYIELAKRSINTMKWVQPLREPEPNRKRIVFNDAVRPLSALKST
jgi:phenylacetic acid degradation protein